MSLLNRLLISVSVVIMCVLIGTVALSVNSARSYLLDQLLVNTENTATSMALTLSQPSNQSASTRELLLSALYDSGQFSLVRLEDPRGNVLFLRDEPVPVTTRVPEWFRAIAGIEAPVSVRQVSSGWEQSGQLSLKLDATYAYEALWSGAVKVLILVLLAGLGWALFAVALMRWFKKILAAEIQRNLTVSSSPDQGQIAPASTTSLAELDVVGTLVSDFRERVQATEYELNERLESLNLELNSDEVTGLPNRRYFINALRASLMVDTADAHKKKLGHVLIIRFRDLAELSRSATRSEVDDWLKGVATALSNDLSEYQIPEAIIGRLNGSDFAVLLPGVSGPVATRIAQQLRQRVSMYPSPVRYKPVLRWAIALADYLPGQDVGSVLARLDYRLMRAESAGSVGAIEYSSQADVADSLAQGGEQWRGLLASALDQDRLEVSVEKHIYANGRQLTLYEAYLQLRENNSGQNLMSAYLFMPPAARVGLAGACDLRSIRLGLEQLRPRSDGDLVVRVSGASLLDSDFLDGLRRLFATLSPTDMAVLQRLILEIDAQNLIMCAAQTRELCRLASEFSVRVGIRRLGQRPDALMVLHMAKFHYVKLGGEFIKHLATSLGAGHFVSAVIDTAHALGVRVYIEDVNDSQTLSMLRSKGAYVRLD